LADRSTMNVGDVRREADVLRHFRQTLRQRVADTTSVGHNAEHSQMNFGPEQLIHVPSGMEFPLSTGPETVLGRRDPVAGIFPDVDLSPVDPQRTVARRHARIYRRGDVFFLGEEIGTMNATFLNGTRLETGVPQQIKSGDELRLGEVALRFEVPSL
jgi:hypothetical protein